MPTGKITLIHLLTHTSGLFDYAESDPFDKAILANPQKRWSRSEQLEATQLWSDTKENILKRAVSLLYQQTRDISLSTLSKNW